MKLVLALGLAATVLARPSELLPRLSPPLQYAHLTFHAGPAEYTLDVPADGTRVETNSDLSINIIDAPDYNAITQCTFYTDGEKALVSSISSSGVQQILVGPPQPIRAVRCVGTCVATYGDCYVNGQPVGSCCAGYCAANKCRPWVNPW